MDYKSTKTREDLRREINTQKIELARLTRIYELQFQEQKTQIERLELKLSKATDITKLLTASAFQPPENEKLGTIISIDGNNGAGKSTLRNNLSEAFDHVEYSEQYTIIKESALSALLSGARDLTKKYEGYQSLRDKEQTICHAVSAGRLLEGRPKLLNRLKERKIIILDRYIWTTLAYQLRVGVPIDEIAIQVANSFIFPSESIVLTCEPLVARNRSAQRFRVNDREIEDINELSSKIEGYKKLSGYLKELPTYHHYDTTAMTETQVAQQVINDVITKYVDKETKDKMLNYIEGKVTENPTDTLLKAVNSK